MKTISILAPVVFFLLLSTVADAKLSTCPGISYPQFRGVYVADPRVDCKHVPAVIKKVLYAAKVTKAPLSGLSIYLQANTEGKQEAYYHYVSEVMSIYVDPEARSNSLEEAVFHEFGHHFDYSIPEIRNTIDGEKSQFSDADLEKLVEGAILLSDDPIVRNISGAIASALEKLVLYEVDSILSELLGDVTEAALKKSPEIAGFNYEFYKDNRSFAPGKNTQEALSLFGKGLFLAGGDPYLATVPFRQYLGSKIDFKNLSEAQAGIFLVKLRAAFLEVKKTFKKEASPQGIKAFSELPSGYWRDLNTGNWIDDGQLKTLDIQKLNEELISRVRHILN